MVRSALALALVAGISSAAFAQTSAPSNPPAATAPMTAPATNAPAATPPATSAPAAAAPSTAAPSATAAGGAMTATMTGEQMYSSKLIGLNITNQDNQNVGEITDVAFTAAGVSAYIVSVGGFLGLGTRYVALAPSAVNVAWDATAKKWVAKVNTTADQLKAAPEFKYPDV